MRYLVLDQPEWIGQWVATRCNCIYLPGAMTTIGVVNDAGIIVGGAIFYDYTGTNVWMHVAVDPGCYGCKSLIQACFSYVFNQLGCKRVSGWVPAGNTAAKRLDERLGFTVEHTLHDADANGDFYLMSMYRDQCRWI